MSLYSIVRDAKDMEEDKRRKQLLFRSQHRGFNEMDQLLTAFARAKLATLTESELDDYASLLDLADWDVFGWLVGQSSPPANMAHIVGLIRAHMATKNTSS